MLWQIKVVQMILEQWDVIEIAATGSGKSLPYWIALLFIKHGIIVLVTPSSELCKLTTIHVGQSLIYCRGPQ
jgi:superfamily II DNA helicase RecQ